MKDKKLTPAGFYEPPQVDLTTLSVERGFASSLTELDPNEVGGWE